jgi:proteasome assembly chaperone (PAC2) family protein
MAYNVEFIEIEKLKLDKPVLIQGLPGLGYVGKVTVDYLIEKLETVKIAELYSRYLTLEDGNIGIIVGQDGTYTLPKFEFHALTNSSPNLIFLTGDIQPQFWGQFEIANRILDYIQNSGGDTVIAIGGYGTHIRKELQLTFAIVNDEKMSEKMRGMGAEVARSGTIRGAFAVLLGVAKLKQMQCIGLLGATRGLYPDIDASRRIVKILMNMYSLQIDTSDLDIRVNDMREKMRRLQEIQRKITAPTAQERVRQKPPFEYII